MKLGKAFHDSVISEKRIPTREVNEDAQIWWLGVGRVLIFVIFFCIAFFILLWRLFDLTVVRGHHFRNLADGNRTRELIRHAPRGVLLDRTGKPLVTNIPYYRLINPCTGEQIEACVTPLSQEEGMALEKKGLPAGSYLEVDYRREYIYPEALAHVVGYTGQITEDEMKDDYYALRLYRRGDRIGRTGAEAVYEELLRGRDGKELVEVDASGAIIRTLGRDKETAGENITLSIDAEIQKKAAESFPVGEKGAVVVSKPTTGEIIAAYSSPSYDMNAFSLGLSQKEYEALMANPDKPMFDRVIGGVYPPGSTFKLVTAIAALEEGAIKADTVVEDVGVLTIGPFKFPNWFFLQHGKTDGTVDLVKALQRSNDIFFYKTGEWLGITKLVSWAQKMGLGKPLGIEFGGEASGLMPDPAWKKIHFSSSADKIARNDEWYLGDTYHISIGQGYLLVTPLQVNTWTNIVANGGVLCHPTVKKAEARSRVPFGSNIIPNCADLGISPGTLSLVTEGMRRACITGGTGWPLFDFAVTSQDGQKKSVPIACKTGTAEFGDPKNHTHAWFTAFAPLPAVASAKAGLPEEIDVITGDPEISVTVLVEGAGEGSTVAAPVAKKILEAWFSR